VIGTDGRLHYEAFHDQIVDYELINVLTYIFTAKQLDIMIGYKCGSIKGAKAQRLVDTYRRLWRFAQRPGAMSWVLRTQRKWRASRERPQPVNDTDPFTCDTIADIDPTTLFYSKDGAGHWYAFVASELDYYVRTVAAANPYTREPFSADDLRRLDAMMQQLPRKEEPNPETLWRTPGDAYTYVFYYYEQDGFYLNIDSFIALTPQQIINIFEVFHIECIDNDEQRIMNIDEVYDAICTGEFTAMHFALAKEMLTVVRGAFLRKFYIICNILLACSVVSRRIARTLPNWVLLGTTQVS
jgi:hypothetical protein